ncbi:LacI family DNA-binding transcriptional regulator [Alkalicoccus daliensis]|uniref:Transcriptional regulator, LacI family n=1 Tax=Alkalicoccus daliensis TaxID=745820 RepID=A0A1H0IN85_9BACI|nr:LacI family DNA-binding transcriptional regulator [Alkalicoccus daliensis]SDO32934.1 transcriptional regulator, LacI family [Alkalicoccus daliensis]
MVNINEIARLAGVSRTTVSRALNQSGYVSEKARKKITKVIEETGYVPSEQAKSLRLQRTKVIGVVLPKISTETLGRIVEGIDEILSASGYQILLANSSLNKEKEIAQLKLLESRRVDGIILAATNREETLMQTIRELRVPLIAVGQDLPEVSSVIYDDFNAAKTIMKKMISKGYRRIGFIGVEETDQAVGQFRKQAYLDVMNEENIEIQEGWMQQADFNIQSGEASMEAMLQVCSTRPEAVFAVTDRLAVGAMQTIRKRGLRVPEEIGIAGIGASEISRYVTPPLTTIDYQYEEAGRESARLLLEQLESGKKSVKKSVMNYGLLERDSLI